MKVLKVLLWIAAIACLAAVPFIFFPWSVVENIAAFFGVTLPDTPIVIYYFKGVFGVFGLVGCFFILLAKDPIGYSAMLNLGAWGLLLFGVLALILGPLLDLPAVVYLGDGLTGMVLGGAILFFASKVRQQLDL